MMRNLTISLVKTSFNPLQKKQRHLEVNIKKSQSIRAEIIGSREALKEHPWNKMALLIKELYIFRFDI